jgi:hypothetical protein
MNYLDNYSHSKTFDQKIFRVLIWILQKIELDKNNKRFTLFYSIFDEQTNIVNSLKMFHISKSNQLDTLFVLSIPILVLVNFTDHFIKSTICNVLRNIWTFQDTIWRPACKSRVIIETFIIENMFCLKEAIHKLHPKSWSLCGTYLRVLLDIDYDFCIYFCRMGSPGFIEEPTLIHY